MENLKQTKVNLAEQPWEPCDKCGSYIFVPKLMFKKISGLITGTGKAEYLPVEVFTCDSCGEIPNFVKEKLPPLP